MKKSYIFILFVLALLYSCATDDVQTSGVSPEQLRGTRISSGLALNIANKVIGKQLATRGLQCDNPVIDYVVNTQATRFSGSQDTLAYIINYPNNGGFVIVAYTNNVYPVLAFSDEGNFSFSNEISKANFIENIGAYIAESDENATFEVGDNDFDGCYAVSPIIKTSLDQGAPWDKYVIQEHPGCPVGCVAVATALVMTHSKKTLTYHGSTFHFKPMVDAIAKATEEQEEDETVDTSILGPTSGIFLDTIPIHVSSVLPYYSYEQAVDSMARLMYWIGKDVNMSYSTTGSGAQSINAYYLCSNMGFTIPSGYANFDINDITWYLKDGHIVYLRGRDLDKNAGHAWVCDGCYFCVDQNDKSTILDTYVHCDWGWGGSCNGYYSSSVFSAYSYNFTPQNYFAVKREW